MVAFSTHGGWCPAVWVLTESAKGKVRADKIDIIAARAPWRRKGGGTLHSLIPSDVRGSPYETICRLCDGYVEDMTLDETLMMMNGEIECVGDDNVLKPGGSLFAVRAMWGMDQPLTPA